jgi:Protein of unknown function (DUF1822)
MNYSTQEKLIHKYDSSVRLRQWLEGIYTSEWQSVEELSQQRNLQLAFRFRSKRIRGFSLDTPESLWHLIQQMYPQRDWKTSLPKELFTKLNFQQSEDFAIAPIQNNQVALVDILVYLIETTSDEESRWTIAEILWTLEPNHPAISAKRIMDLGMQLGGNPVALMVAILPKPDRSVAVLLRVYPTGNQNYLPAGLKLAGLYDDGKPFLEVEAREIKDDYIQLKFCAEFGERFQVRVSINNACITEEFLI